MFGNRTHHLDCSGNELVSSARVRAQAEEDGVANSQVDTVRTESSNSMRPTLHLSPMNHQTHAAGCLYGAAAAGRVPPHHPTSTGCRGRRGSHRSTARHRGGGGEGGDEWKEWVGPLLDARLIRLLSRTRGGRLDALARA
eukprot:TRINITY_DN40908_c0_g1_i1.p2 TRINITY_DN40908_c0_g1~~TRINITY_DN40908_c0_g1_i1.p2  ORF type:complete len:140 (-),score=0.81 TRINITY_DN40908_c0_g1_i1:170-589(-)